MTFAELESVGISSDFNALAAPSRDNKKDIVPENPDKIGVFAVLGGDFLRAKIIDVKWTFSLCQVVRTLTTTE